MDQSKNASNTPKGKIAHTEQDYFYPDVLVSGVKGEDLEEDNPTAFTLLTKIEDPYYKDWHSSMGDSKEGELLIFNYFYLYRR